MSKPEPESDGKGNRKGKGTPAPPPPPPALAPAAGPAVRVTTRGTLRKTGGLDDAAQRAEAHAASLSEAVASERAANAKVLATSLARHTASKMMLLKIRPALFVAARRGYRGVVRAAGGQHLSHRLRATHA